MDFIFEFLDRRRILMLHGDKPPAAAAWRDHLRQLEELDVESLGLLVFTNGGAPDAGQRDEMNRVLRGRYFARAIVHRSAIARGVVAAVGWFAPGVAAFRPECWHAAAAHARFAPDELGRVERQARLMNGSLAAPIPWLSAAMADGESPPSVEVRSSQRGRHASSGGRVSSLAAAGFGRRSGS
jgi:hypothetical protein